MRFPLRRRICRLVFCLFCALPTALVGGAALVVNSPPYLAARADSWQTHLANRLGLEVHLQSIEWQDVDNLVVRGIELRDPESHQWLARARSARVTHGESGIVVELGQPELDFRRLPRLVEVLYEHLLLRSDHVTNVCQIRAPCVVLPGNQAVQTVLDAQFTLEAGAGGSEAFLEFRPVGAVEGYQLRLRVVRNRQLDPPATGWELHTGAAGLPCSLVTAWLPQLEHCGTDCTFQGSVWTEQASGAWNAEAAGVLGQLDLDALVSDHFPHKLSGLAELSLKRLLIRQNQVAVATGELHSLGGVVSLSLLDAVQQHLGMRQHPRPGDANRLTYNELSLQFAINGQILAIAPLQEVDRATAVAAILSDSRGPLLSVYQPVELPPLALVQALAPQAELQVPATRETASLLRLLPLPELAPSASATARLDLAPLDTHRR